VVAVEHLEKRVWDLGALKINLRGSFAKREAEGCGVGKRESANARRGRKGPVNP